jgi:hypothetical protein
LIKQAHCKSVAWPTFRRPCRWPIQGGSVVRPLFSDRLIRTNAVNWAVRLDALQLAMVLELHRRGAAAPLVASERNLCEVAAVEGMQVVKLIQGPLGRPRILCARPIGWH